MTRRDSHNARSSSGNASPLSFFVSELQTINEADNHSVSSRYSRSHRMSKGSDHRLSEERASNPSSGITALPRWDNIKSTARSGMHVSLPFVPRRAHFRSNSETPMFEKDLFGRDSRPDSRLSKSKSETSDTERRRRRLSRRMVWLIATLTVLLIVAIVLGAVLGSYAKAGYNRLHPTVTEIPAGSVPTPTGLSGDHGNSPSPTGTPLIASVSVTGWSVPGSQGYNSIWLFWQSRTGYLSRATYNTSTGNWTRVANFVEAKRDTPISATTLDAGWYNGQDNYPFSNVQYQTSVRYLDNNNYLNEWIFPDTGPEAGQPGPLTQQKYIANEQTQIASYWPQIFYQGLSGEIRGADYACHEKNECWHERVLRTTDAMNGTHLSAVPGGNNLSSLILFYQEDDNKVILYEENDEEEGELLDNVAFSNLIPPNASFAAFAIARLSNPGDQKLNTYLLWQDTNGTIQMSWTDDNQGWKGPITFPAFAGAEKNTALTCLTGLTFPGYSLEEGTELARCYFQTGFAVREVGFDGNSWNIFGVVPIDL